MVLLVNIAYEKESIYRNPRTFSLICTIYKNVKGFMSVRLNAEIFSDPISYKRMTLIKHVQLSEFMISEFQQYGFVYFARNWCLDL